MFAILMLLSRYITKMNLLFDQRNSSTFCSRSPEARSFGGAAANSSGVGGVITSAMEQRPVKLEFGPWCDQHLHLLLDVDRVHTAIGTVLEVRKASQGARSVELTVVYRSVT